MNQAPWDPVVPPPIEFPNAGTDTHVWTLAPRSARAAAALIDGGSLVLAYLALSCTLLPTLQLGHFDGDDEWLNAVPIQIHLVLVLFGALHGYLLAASSQTLGCRTLGLRIVRSSGEHASLGRILALRYFLSFVIVALPHVGIAYAILDMLFMFRASRQCLHDIAADTVVIVA